MNRLGPLLIVVTGLALVAGVLWWKTDRRDGGETSAESGSGDPVVSSETLRAATRIELAREEGSFETVLEKNETGVWVLPDYHEVPADSRKLMAFVRDLQGCAVDRHVTSQPDRMRRLELGGSRVRLLGPAGSELVRLDLGATGPGGGRFVRVGETESAFVTREDLAVDADPENWIERKLFPFEEEDVARVEFQLEDEVLVFSRSSANERFAGVGLAENEEARREVSDRVGVLARVRLIRAVDRTDTDIVDAREHLRTVRLELFSGETYTLAAGRRPGIVPVRADEGPMRLPGRTFIFHQSDAPGFAWEAALERAGLEVSERIIQQFPRSRRELVRTTNRGEGL